MSKTNGHDHSREGRMSKDLASKIKKLLKDGASPAKLAREFSVGYMAVYKIAIGETWKSNGSTVRLIPIREARLGSEQRKWAVRMKKKGKSNRYIAKKLEVSETSVCRLLKDARLLVAHSVQSMLLSSGTNAASMRKYGIDSKEVTALITLAATTPLPPRLRAEMEEL